MMSTTGSDVTSSAVNAVPEKVTLGVPTGRIDPGDGMTGRNVVDRGRITGTIDHQPGIEAILRPGRVLP